VPICSVPTISRVLLRLCAPANYVILLLDLLLILLFMCVCLYFCVFFSVCILSYDDCLEVRKENDQNWTVLCCVVYDSCAQWCAHTCEPFLNLQVGLGFDFVFVCLFRFSILCIFVCDSLVHFIPMLLAFVCFQFSCFSTKPRDWLGRTSPKWPVLCRVGHKTLSQSIIPKDCGGPRPNGSECGRQGWLTKKQKIVVDSMLVAWCMWRYRLNRLRLSVKRHFMS